MPKKTPEFLLLCVGCLLVIAANAKIVVGPPNNIPPLPGSWTAIVWYLLILGAQNGRVLVLGGAVRCESETDNPRGGESGLTKENTGETIQIAGETASRASRIRTYDLRIRNPLLYPTEL
jgi:hypothetical protein